MAVEEILVPVRAIFGICKLRVETHDRGEELSDEKDGETGDKVRVEFCSGLGICFALDDVYQHICVLMLRS